MPEKCVDYPRDCPLISRVEALEEANRQHSATHRNMFDRLGALETLSAVQETKLDTINGKLDTIQLDQKNLLQKLEALEAKPAKRWEGLVNTFLSVLAGAVVGYIMFKLGLSA